MANVIHYKPIQRTFLGDNLGRNDPFTSLTTTQFVTDGSGYKCVFTGNFNINNGEMDFDRSYISKLEVFFNGVIVVSYQNINISPGELVSAYLNGGSSGINSRVYKFDDRITGSSSNDSLDTGWEGNDQSS